MPRHRVPGSLQAVHVATDGVCVEIIVSCSDGGALCCSSIPRRQRTEQLAYAWPTSGAAALWEPRP